VYSSYLAFITQGLCLFTAKTTLPYFEAQQQLLYQYMAFLGSPAFIRQNIAESLLKRIYTLIDEHYAFYSYSKDVNLKWLESACKTLIIC
jgi:hypothetical protein